MTPTPFTPELGAEIVAAALKFCEKKTSLCSPVVYVKTNGTVEPAAEVCHAPVVSTVTQGNHSDILGLMYRGGGYGKDKGNHSCTENLGPEARDYLVHLMHKDSPFKDLFPYIWKTDVDAIMADKTIVCHNLSDKGLNPGLFWTFAQATRYMFEHPTCMARFQYLKAKYPDNPNLVTLATYSFQPWSNANMDGDWTIAMQGHCAPLGGTYPWLKAEGFLNGKIVPFPHHQTSRSHQCFEALKKNPIEVNYCSPTKKPLDELIRLMTGGDAVAKGGKAC